MSQLIEIQRVVKSPDYSFPGLERVLALVEEKKTTAGFGLPQVLNIVYRGHRLVIFLTLLGAVAGVAYGLITKPLFRASVQVRPGIVSYSEQGAPVREWALKDVVRWFRSGLYWDDLRASTPYQDLAGPPVILADFISSGPQYLRGGDIITLTNLSTDPLVAVDILKQAVASFNAQANRDSTTSTLQLTLGGARVKMDKIQAEMDKLGGDRERADLGIQELETQQVQLDAEAKRLQKKIDRLNFGRQWRLDAVDKTLAESAAARKRLAAAQKMLDSLKLSASPGGGDSPSAGNKVDQVLFQAVQRNEAIQAGELLTTVNELGSYIYNSTARADSLRDKAAELEATIADLTLKKNVDLAQQKKVIQLKIDELVIQRDIDLKSTLAGLKADLKAEQVKVAMLTPLEQVGRVTVSSKPVRPRKSRAVVILTVLAFMGGLFLVFVREYFYHNRETILDRSGGQ